MRHARRERYEWHLTDRIERLRATDLDDLNAAWAATVDVLAALYRCEEAEKWSEQSHANYFADRNASPDGQALGGLVWFRAKVEHYQAEIEEMVGLPATFAGVPMTFAGVPATFSAAPKFQWPDGSKLPEGKGSKPYERDRYYKDLVEGPDLFGPLDAAARYLLGR